MRTYFPSALKFLLGVATPVDCKTILSWSINTHCLLLIALPSHKCIAWSRDMNALITSPSVCAKDLKVLIGRLNHIGYFLPLTRHFLSHLCHTHLGAHQPMLPSPQPGTNH